MRVSAPCHWAASAQISVRDLTTEHVGRRVQVPGNRGVIRGVWTDDDGSVALVTTVGVGHYDPDTLAWIEATS